MSALTVLVLALGAGPLSLGEVLASTRESYPALVAARADVEAADGDQLAAAGAFDPVWRTRAWTTPISGYPQTRVDSVVEVPTPLWGSSFFGGYRLGTGKIQSYYGERETWSAGELRVGAVVPIIRNGPIDRRRATEARAALGQSMAGLSVEQQQLELNRLATWRYWDWVAAGRRREIARSLLQLAKDRDVQLSARANAGDVAQFDRQDNARALVQREAFVVQTQRALDQSAFELSLFLRDETGAPVIPPETRLPSLPDPHDAQQDLDPALALTRRPDVKRLIDQKKQAEIELRFANNQLLPSLDVGVALSKDLGVPNRPEAAALGPAELEFNAVLEVPLLYRAPLGRMQSARASLSKLEAQLRLARDRVAMELNDTRSAFTAALDRLGLARQEIAVASQLEQGERTRFDLGDSSLLFVNLREQATVEAKLREIDALLDGHRAQATLLAALGTTESK